MGKKEGAKSSAIFIALLINAAVLLVGIGVLLFIYLDTKKDKVNADLFVVESTETEDVSESVEEPVAESVDEREEKYLKALEALEGRDTTKALRYFNSIPDYKDSNQYVLNIGKYLDSCNLAEALEFSEASLELRDCNGILDSDGRADDYDLLANADMDIMAGEFDEDKENDLYANLKALTEDEARFLLCKSMTRGMLYLGTLDEKEEVGKIMAELGNNRDWLASLEYSGDYTVYGESSDGFYYGAPSDPAYSSYSYGPLNDDGAAFFWYYRDKEETDYYYMLIYSYTDIKGETVYATGYFEKDGTVMDWFKY